MREDFFLLLILFVVSISCKDDDINLFDKSADERTAEAIANLKADLVSAENGWLVNYQPEANSGSYYVLLKFFDDNRVTIASDLGSNGGEFFEDTITYRIDSSLGLELIFESYSFFSFLFEQNAASFMAEYEFLYQEKTEEGNLVFRSKTDQADPTIFTMEQALPSSIEILGQAAAEKLEQMVDDTYKYASTLKIDYEDIDLAFVFTLDDITRSIDFTSAYTPSGSQNPVVFDFQTTYHLKGDSLVLTTPLTGTYFNRSTNLKSIYIGDAYETSVSICTAPLEIDGVNGVTSENQNVRIETSFEDPKGAAFTEASDFFFALPGYVSEQGNNRGSDIVSDIPGTIRLDLYYNLELNDGSFLNAIGVVIENPGGSITFALREFTLEKDGNNLIFTFAPDISIFGDPTSAPVENLNQYLEALTEGNKTYAFYLFDDVYEFYNPCNGWSFIFVNGN